MFKKFFNYPVFLVLFLSIIGSLGLASLVAYHFEGGTKYQTLQKTAIFFASVPRSIRYMTKYGTFNLNKPPTLSKHKDKKRFEQFVENKRNALLVLPRYDHSLSRSVN